MLLTAKNLNVNACLVVVAVVYTLYYIKVLFFTFTKNVTCSAERMQCFLCLEGSKREADEEIIKI